MLVPMPPPCFSGHSAKRTASRIILEVCHGMNPNLGLVCITSGESVRYRTTTRKQLLSLPLKDQKRKLREIYEINLTRFGNAIDYCLKEGIKLYRLISGAFPFSDEKIGRGILDSMRDELAEQGKRAMQNGLRVVMHPDQFVVLNSESEQVVKNSIKILEMHAHTLDLFGLPQTAWTALEIHGGKGGRSEQLVRAIEGLDDNIRSRLALENDERIYSAAEIHSICKEAGVPMVFDAHHHIVYEDLESYDDPSVEKYFEAAAGTWPDRSWQMVHISNGKEFFRDPRHHDLISVMPRCCRKAPWIEVEAKSKEFAIQKIRLEARYG
jgi:UV DNA damage endonuclease